MKILCVLYDDLAAGYPKTYARDDLPALSGYPGGQTLPTPSEVDFTPGHLLGSVSGELGLRRYLETLGHELVVTSSKDAAIRHGVTVAEVTYCNSISVAEHVMSILNLVRNFVPSHQTVLDGGWNMDAGGGEMSRRKKTEPYVRLTQPPGARGGHPAPGHLGRGAGQGSGRLPAERGATSPCTCRRTRS